MTSKAEMAKMAKKPAGDTSQPTRAEGKEGHAEGAPTEGRVDLPLPAYHALMEHHSAPKETQPPVRYAVLRADYRGVVGTEHTRFSCTLELRVFATGWTQVPLFGDELAVIGLAVEEGSSPPGVRGPHADEGNEPLPPPPAATDSGSEHIIRSGAETRAGTPEEDGTPPPAFELPPALPASNEPALTLVSEPRQHVLLVARPGHYTVHLDLLAGFRGEVGRSGLQFQVPRAAITRLELALPRTGIDVTVKRALSCECEELDAAAERADDEPQGAFTRLVAMLSPSTQMQMEWTQAVDESAEPALAARPVLTAEAETLVGVGEGLLLCQSRVTMEVLQGQTARFRFLLPAEVNVLGVSCPVARTWRVRELAAGEAVPPLHPSNGDAQGGGQPQSASGGLISAGPSDAGEGLELPASAQLIEVLLSHDVSGRHPVHLVYERRMEATSGRASVPSLQVLDVDRQRGHVGVEARTNVEVAVADEEAVARVDVQELGRAITSLAENPLLFGFKYLRAPYSIALDIHKHEDVEVLVASIDLACVEATLVVEGKLETRCVFKVRNNQQQFLRLKLPPASTVWSSYVSHEPVKPASDANTGELLIPLTKSQDVEDLHRAFPVELVYLTEMGKLDAQAGEFDWVLPRVDVPMHHLLVQLHVPKEYRFDRFEGSLKQLPHFTRPFEVEIARPNEREEQRRARSQVQSERNVSFGGAQRRQAGHKETLEESPIIEAEEMQQIAMEAPAAPVKTSRPATNLGFGGSSKGILPVKLEPPKVGDTLRFEQMLVLHEPPTAKMRYRKRRRPSWPWPRK